MADINISNIDEVLRAMRLERADIERKEKVRDEEYKRATKLYIKALQKESEAFERNRPNYDKRNESFKDEMEGIKERFKVGAFGLIKSNDRLHKEIDKLNNHLLEHYPKLASQVKDNLQREKEELELKLRQVKENNERNNVPLSRAQMPSVSVMDIRQKRHELEKDLRPGETPYFTNVDPRNQKSHDNYQSAPSIRHHSPYRNQSYLDEFVAKPNPADLNVEASRRSPQSIRPNAIDVAYSQPYTHSHARSKTPPSYGREQDIRKSSKSPPKTDLLSEFLFPIPKTVFSPPPNEMHQRKQSPTKSESLLYSPFTAGGDNESRFSRMSSVKKSQNF